MISPNFAPDKLDLDSIEDWIDIFEDRIVHWILKPASHLLKYPNSFFAVCQLLMPYFEGIAIYLNGRQSKRKPKRFFADGFVAVFQSSGFQEDFLRRVADILYEDARCGFFHDNMIRKRIFFKKAESAICPNVPKVNGQIDIHGEITAIIIDSEKLLNEIENHFTQYIRSLRDQTGTNLRNDFSNVWKSNYPSNRAIIEIGNFEEYAPK